jgi:hypothetical protein
MIGQTNSGSGVSPLKSRDGSSTLHVSPFNQIGGLGKAHQLLEAEGS